MSLKVSKKSIINLMVICIPLCPYKFISVGDKDISAMYLIWGLLILFGMMDIHDLERSLKKNWIVLVGIGYFIINTFILNVKNIGSILQFVLLWMILLFSYRRVSENEFQITIDLFHKVINILAIYGIYEFAGRILHLPFSDPWINGMMVDGYNWYNSEQVGGLVVYRSNGIFVEPSMFSQYLAINILLYIFASRVGEKRKTKEIIINAIALICSFSGTGFLLLLVASIMFSLSKGGVSTLCQVLRKYRFWVGILVIVAFTIIASPVGSYMFSRLAEFDPTNTKSISGYIRFVGQFNIASEIWKKSPILGIGIGNVQSFINEYRMSGSAEAFASLACSMILARYAAELGFIGVVIIVIMYKGFIRKQRTANPCYKVLLICVIIMIPLCDSGISVSYWLLLYLINFDFYPPVEAERGLYGEKND